MVFFGWSLSVLVFLGWSSSVLVFVLLSFNGLHLCFAEWRCVSWWYDGLGAIV